MADDTIIRAKKVQQNLYERTLALSHPNGDRDMSDVLAALAMILEMQLVLADGQRQIVARLDRQS